MKRLVGVAILTVLLPAEASFGLVRKDQCATLNADLAEPTTEDGARVLVVLRARRCRLEQVRIRISKPNGDFDRIARGVLRRGDVITWTRSLDGRESAYVEVRYAARGRSAGFLAPLNRRLPSEADAVNSTVVVAGLGLLGTLAAVWLAETFAVRRDRRQRRQEWNRMLLDRYEPAYRSFLATWGGAASADLLVQRFEVLRREAHVPASLRAMYESTLAELRGAGTEGARQAAAGNLQRAVDALLAEPEKFLH